MASTLFSSVKIFRSVIYTACNFQKNVFLFFVKLKFTSFILTKSRRCLFWNKLSNETSTATPLFCYRFVSLSKFNIKCWFYMKTSIYFKLTPVKSGRVPNVLKQGATDGKCLRWAITLANKIWIFQSFLDKLWFFFITYSYLTTECGAIFTLSGLSFAYYFVKDTYYEGSLNKAKS